MFFQDSSVTAKLRTLYNLVGSFADPSDKNYNKAKNLHTLLPFFIEHGAELDKNCEYTIDRYGHLIRDAQFANVDVNSLNYDVFVAAFYLFLKEYDLSLVTDIPFELARYCDFVRDAEMQLNQQAQAIIDIADNRLHIALLKSLLNGDKVTNLKDIPLVAEKAHARVKSWTNELKSSVSVVKSLQTKLDKQKDAFNFVGLFNGFNELSIIKKKELRDTRIIMFFLGLVIFIPVGFDIILLFTHRADVLGASSFLVGVFATATFSTTFILLYFYRIFLKTSQSCKAQLLHIELRKTLCRFIQRYVKYAEDLKENKELLIKFESVIFAPIPFGEEANPSMFDGLDQVSNLVKAVREKS